MGIMTSQLWIDLSRWQKFWITLVLSLIL